MKTIRKCIIAALSLTLSSCAGLSGTNLTITPDGGIKIDGNLKFDQFASAK